MLRQSVPVAATIVVGVLVILGSAQKPPEPDQPVNCAPNFDWAAETQAKPRSANVAFAVINPQFPATARSGWGESQPPVLSDFQTAMGSDFEELLAARGFSVRGPFAAYDELTYPDKKGSDLLLEPEINLTFTDLGTAVNCRRFAFPPSCVYSGTVQVNARMNLALAESVSREKMWTKSIALDSKQVKWRGTNGQPMNRLQSGEVVPPPRLPFGAHFSDPGFTCAVAPLLQSYYGTILNSAWNHLNPEEMASVVRQSRELRGKKVY